ncbi:MAG: LptF/LptG family permease [Cyanobacteria bacterium J06641_5]
MRPSVLDRYLVGEFLLPFCFGVGMFLSLGLSVGAVFELVRAVAESGLEPRIAVQVLLLRLPQFLAYAFPMATLLASLTAYGRLANDSEIVALRGAGISIARIVTPILLVCLLISGITFVFNEAIVPEANFRGRIVFKEALGKSRPPFRETNILFTEFGDRPTKGDGQRREMLVRFFYAEQFDGDRMLGVTAIDRSDPEYERIINAESAIWNPARNLWEFQNGTLYLVAPDASYRDVIRFQRQTLQLPRTPLDIGQSVREFSEMNLLQSFETLQRLQQGGKASSILKLRVRIQQKFAFPFICLVFGAIGSSLGIDPRKMSRATSFGISTLATFLYYLLAFTTTALGQVGFLSPFMAAWLPNFLGLGLGFWLLRRAAR